MRDGALKWASEFRVWKYEYAADLPNHGMVRVTYKATLLSDAEATRGPEWKPHIVNAAGDLVTDPSGQIFMKEGVFFNPFCPRPRCEQWKPAEPNHAEGTGRRAAPAPRRAAAAAPRGGQAAGAAALAATEKPCGS